MLVVNCKKVEVNSEQGYERRLIYLFLSSKGWCEIPRSMVENDFSSPKSQHDQEEQE